MPAPPLLLIVVGTRSEMLAVATLLEATGTAPLFSLPFTPRLLVTGQEATELTQALDYLEVEPAADLGVKNETMRLADAALNARLLEEMEKAMRHHAPAAVLCVGRSATAWATAMAAYFKDIPLIHLQAGQFAADSRLRPFPEWLHGSDLARLARLQLCPDALSARALGERLAGSAATVEDVGNGADEVLARSLAAPPPGDCDPTLAGLRPDAPRVLIFLRRREHHANALRPLCLALGDLAAQRGDHDFVVFYSLQSHICDALAANLPKSDHVLGVPPLPHPAFARELSRARLVVTDSAGVGREAALLGRPLLCVGAYSPTGSLTDIAQRQAPYFATVDMERAALGEAIDAALDAEAPGPASQEFQADRAGARALEAITQWWRSENGPSGPVGRS